MIAISAIVLLLLIFLILSPDIVILVQITSTIVEDTNVAKYWIRVKTGIRHNNEVELFQKRRRMTRLNKIDMKFQKKIFEKYLHFEFIMLYK